MISRCHSRPLLAAALAALFALLPASGEARPSSRAATRHLWRVKRHPGRGHLEAARDPHPSLAAPVTPADQAGRPLTFKESLKLNLLKSRIRVACDETGNCDQSVIGPIRRDHPRLVADTIRELVHTELKNRESAPGSPYSVTYYGSGLSLDAPEVRRTDSRADHLSGRPNRSSPMKAFERLVARAAPHQPLLRQDYYIVSDLHLISTMTGLFESLADSGVPESRMLLKGVRHSQSQVAIDGLQRMGFRVMPAAEGASDAEYRALVQRILDVAKKNPNARFLVGGHGGRVHQLLTEALDQPGTPPDLASRVAIGETTHKGAKRMSAFRDSLRAAGAPAEKVVERFPVVDIGTHWAKLQYESPIIGLSCANAMHEELQGLSRRGVAGVDVARGRVPVLLLGYGNVGRETARMLRDKGYEVHVADPKLADPAGTLWAQAVAAGVKPHRSAEEALRRGVKVIGSATGEQPFTASVLKAMPQGAVVFNLASPGEMDSLLALPASPVSSRPGGSAATRFAGRDLALQPVAKDHQDSSRRIGSKSVLLAHGGQVINLATGWTAPSEYIQLTRGLTMMLFSRLSEIVGKAPGSYSLDDRRVRAYVRDVQSDLRAAGLGSLENPTYRNGKPGPH